MISITTDNIDNNTNHDMDDGDINNNNVDNNTNHDTVVNDDEIATPTAITVTRSPTG